MSGERTEKPTGKRLRDARVRGQVPRSRDLTQALSLGAVLIALSYVGPWVVGGLANELQVGLVRVGEWALRQLAAEDLTVLLVNRAVVLAQLTAPVALVAAVSAVAFASAQSGWVWAPQALSLRWESLNPASGLQRLVPSRAGVDLLKTVLVALALGYLCWGTVERALESAEPLSRMPIEDAVADGWQRTYGMLRDAVILLVALAAADYGLQRHRHTESLMMTKQEVKEDSKMMEGNPEIKARVRRVQREVARRRMLAAVPKATVVITNPTHYAVALEYQRTSMAAPVVVAKGKNLIAARIKAIAKEHGVPIVENKPLAQALYRGADVGDSIPGDLFEAVAEVLAYLIRLKQLAL